MLVRADLRERLGRPAGPPHREQAQAPDGPTGAPPPDDRDIDRRSGPMIRNERHITIRSGELIVGLLSRSTHGPDSWSWILSGVERPDDEDFIWNGDAGTDNDALDRIELAWARWTWWAGLESVAPLQRGVRRAARP